MEKFVTIKSLYNGPLSRNVWEKVQAGGSRAPEGRLDPADVRRVARIFIEEVKRSIRAQTWRRPPVKLLRSFRVIVDSRRLQIRSSHPAILFLEKGSKPHWQKRRPIPIQDADGSMIFRYPRKEISSGENWQHPGTKARHIIGRSLERARRRAIQVLANEAKKRLLADFTQTFQRGLK